MIGEVQFANSAVARCECGELAPSIEHCTIESGMSVSKVNVARAAVARELRPGGDPDERVHVGPLAAATARMPKLPSSAQTVFVAGSFVRLMSVHSAPSYSRMRA